MKYLILVIFLFFSENSLNQIMIFFAGSCTSGTFSALEGSLMVENGSQSSSTTAKVKRKGNYLRLGNIRKRRY